ncbi:protein RRNAD1 isoform X2 [Quercus lobata]|uniref:protein RRNAD1 isoform X2 n=1 Tax=Quercus lobata TaxID=97700 RepID=UPI001246D824|nr:protein RRNAD1 isoform X2 [Quercus lobata]
MEFSTASDCKYSCDTAAHTLHWINAIIHFLKPFTFFMHAHVVNFFKDRLWESVDKEWMDCLRNEPVENLLLIPSGVVQDHWPASLKDFIVTLRSLVFPREQADLQTILPGLHVISLNSVLAQGMNMKKKHEVEVLSAVVNSIADSARRHTIVDVGAGQGYLAQVLSFQYQHSVVAIDACSHHGSIADARAERIKKHYAAQMRKSETGNWSLNVPKTITCRVMSIGMLKALTGMSLHKDDAEQLRSFEEDNAQLEGEKLKSSCNANNDTSLVLAGLHACGDLSVTMLKTFLDCKEVKAIVSIGCCYNLLSEEGIVKTETQCGFPMSAGVKSACFSLGKNSRDLACQSAERWRGMEKDAGLHNFELHCFRAAFQMVLCKYYPEVMITNPSIGRQGKTLRRRQHRKVEYPLNHKEIACPSLHSNTKGSCRNIEPKELETDKNSGLALDTDVLFHGHSSSKSTRCEGPKSVDKYALFEKFSQSGLCRLGLKPSQDIKFHEIWKEAEPFAELVGPYWSLRAALGPLLETFLLLDRLLFLQEQGSSLEVIMLPIFDPEVSPRNVAIIAKKILTQI